MTTKNATFPITLTSLESRDGTTAQGAPKILSAARNDSEQSLDYWDRSDELLFSNYNNETYDDVGASYVWKKDYKRSINDAVSKNITLVLENLLKNYENSQLPTHGKGKAFINDNHALRHL